MPFARSASTIQAACPGGAGPPKASDFSTGTTKRVRSQRRSSRSLDGGATRRRSAPSARAGSGQGGEAGIGLLGEAVELLAGSEARLEHARALVDLGAALRRANQRTEARERLREGVDLARTVAAFGLAERANEEIAATGARPRKVLQTGLDALTASERRVAQLAADGMTNKEIAQTLFVTIKTVEMHLSHAYRKLEISSARSSTRPS